MATAITHEDIKSILGIPSATTTYDTELDALCDNIEASVDVAVTAAFLTASPAFVKAAAIQIAAGLSGLGLLNRSGYAEAVTAGGIVVGALDRSGYLEMIKIGWDMLAPHSVAAAARDTAETAKLTAETARITSDELLVDATELKTDAETALLISDELLVDKKALTEVQQALKVAADATMATGLAADANARAAMATARIARMAAEDAAIVDATDLPQESHEGPDDSTFAFDSEEYST